MGGKITLGERKNIKLDKLDKYLIQTMINNSRTPLSKIAKQKRVSKQVVKYRFERLKKERILLDDITRLDHLKLGFKVYRVRVQGRSDDFTLEKLSKMSNITHINMLESNQQFRMLVIADSHKHFLELLDKITDIADASSFSYWEKKDFYFQPFNLFGVPYKHAKKVEYKKNKLDLNLLKTISFDSRAEVSALAKKLDTSPLTIKSRLKHMHDSGVITCFSVLLNSYALGFSAFCLSITLKKFSKLSHMASFLASQDVVSAVHHYSTAPELEAIAIVRSRLDLDNLIRALTKNFGDLIGSYTCELFVSQLKTDNMPKDF